MSLPDLTNFTILELLSMHSSVLDQLKSLKVVRSQNNPTGDYAEWLVAKKLDLSLAMNSEKGFDATDSTGFRYQIKGRRVTSSNLSTQLSAIRSLDEKNFDYLVAVVFNANWQIQIAAKIPHHAVSLLANFRKNVNGHVMRVLPTIFDNKEIEDIKLLLSD